MTNIEELRKPTALLFDRTGFSSTPNIFKRRQREEAFRQVDIELSDPIYDSYAGRPDTAMIEEILRQWNKSDVSVEEILAIKNQLFFREMKDNICVMPGAKEFLRWANPRYRIALATSATPERIPCYDFKAKSSCPGEEILFSDPTLLSGERGRACKGNHHCCAVDALAM